MVSRDARRTRKRLDVIQRVDGEAASTPREIDQSRAAIPLARSSITKLSNSITGIDAVGSGSIGT